MTEMDLLLRILAATVMGGLVGLERELNGCAAGLRTHILVCIGSTLFMVTSIGVAEGYANMGAVDPSRIAAGVVTGIGFLGAGAIMRYGTSVRGLTTAASIWAVSAVGLAAGAGMFVAGIITTTVALVILILSRLEEIAQIKRQSRRIVAILSEDSETSADDIQQVIGAYGGRTKKIATCDSTREGETNVEFYVMLPRAYRQDTMTELRCLPGVISVAWGPAEEKNK